MSANPVVEALDVLEDGLPGLPSCLEGKALDAFSFQGPEKGFGDCVIITIPSAAHAHGDTDIGKQGLVGITGILRTAIRMRTTSQLPGSAQAAPSGKPAQ